MAVNAVASAMPYIASAVGSIFSGLLSKKGAEDSSALQYQYQSLLNAQNYKYNTQLINKQNAFNEAMMDKANDWNLERWNESVDLANTAHQREVDDLRKAGLNPVLSANGGAAVVNPIQSAQTSSGNSQLSSSAGMPDVDYVGALSTANAIRNDNKRVENELSNSKTQREYTNQERLNSIQRVENETAQSASQVSKNNAEIEKIRADIKNQNAITKAQVQNLKSQSDNYLSNSAKNIQETKNLSYQSSELKRHNDFLNSQSKVGRNVYNWIKAVNGSFGVSAKVR